jgi:AcrR family transcriptional regulator
MSVDVEEQVTRPTKRERTRARLVEGARVVFERDGFIGARITDIAEEASVAHGTFYTHFESKEAAFTAVILELMDQVMSAPSRAMDSHSSPWDSIEASNRSYIGIYQKHTRLMLLWAQVAASNVEIAALLHQQRDAFVARAERGIRRWQEEGLASASIDARITAKALCSMMNEYCAEWLGRDLGFKLDRSVQALTLIWARACGVPDHA